MITLDHLLTGHNFPEAGYWKTLHRERTADYMSRGATREEAEARSNWIDQMIIDVWNRRIAAGDPQMDPYRVWLSNPGTPQRRS